MQDLQKVHLKGGFYIPLQHKNRFNDEQKHGDCRVLATTDDGTSDHPLNLNRDVLRFGRLVPDVQPRKSRGCPILYKNVLLLTNSPHQSRRPMSKRTSHPRKQYGHFPDLSAEGMTGLLLPMNLKKPLVSPRRQDIHCL